MKIFNEIAAFGKDLVHVESVEESLGLISDEAKRIVEAERCSIFMVDKEENILWSKVSDGIDGRIVISADSGIVGDTYKQDKPQIVNDAYKDSRFLPNIDKRSGYKTRNILTVPIYNSKREVMGILELLNKKEGDFNSEDLEVLTFFANYISGTLELVLMRE